MKKIFAIRTLFFFITLMGILFSSSNPVLADGESYVFGGSGYNTSTGVGGSVVLGSGGALKSSGTSFIKVNASSLSSSDKLSGYTVYYRGNLQLNGSASSNDACNGAEAILAFRTSNDQNGTAYLSIAAKNDGCRLDIEPNTTYRLPRNVRVSLNPAFAASNSSIVSDLSSSLQSVRSAYLATPSCVASISNCMGNWETSVGACWTSAVAAAENQASALRNYNTGFDADAYTKQSFSSCLSSAIGGAVSAANILQAIAGVDVGVVTSAANDAATITANASESLANINNNSDDETTTCAIDGVGWIVCPAMTFLGNISDFAFSFLANSFLITDSRLVESGSGTYNAWVVMRNIANIAFVIVFLIIIFSQLTSVGISNYGVKKMLPRLVVAAVLVNASFLVCQLAVDLSNILGSGLKEMLDSVQNYVTPPTVDLDSPTSGTDAGSFVKQGFGVAAIVTALVAGGLTLATTISIPVLLAVVLALLMIVLILMARTALIVILIVASPLAFVAYLLPNTEQWFKKWYKMFGSLLMVYPIIAVVFGGSSLAAQIVNNGATVADGNGDNMLLQLLAIGIAAVPLFVVPSLLKGSIKSAGALGAKLSGWSGGANKRVSSGLKGGLKNTRAAQYLDYKKNEAAKRRALTQAGAYSGRNKIRKLASGINRKVNNSRLSGKFGDNLASRGDALARDMESKEIESAKSLLGDEADRIALQEADPAKRGEVANDHLESILSAALDKGDTVKARAAFSALASRGERGVDAARKGVAASTKMSDDTKAKMMQHINSKHSDLKAKDSRITNWTADGDETKLGVSSGSGHLRSLTNAQVATQTAHSIYQSDIDSVRARAILDDDTLTKEIKPTQRLILRQKAGEALTAQEINIINNSVR